MGRRCRPPCLLACRLPVRPWLRNAHLLVPSCSSWSCLCRTPLPPGLWPALFGMLLGCAMVVGSKAAAGTPPCRGAAAARLWPAQSKEAWLCTAVFGERHGAWLCGSSDAMPSNTTHGTNTAIDGSTGHVHDGGLGLRDALGIGLSFLGASSLAAFMLLVQVSAACRPACIQRIVTLHACLFCLCWCLCRTACSAAPQPQHAPTVDACRLPAPTPLLRSVRMAW